METVLGDCEADVEPLEEEVAEGVLLVDLGLQEGAQHRDGGVDHRLVQDAVGLIEERKCMKFE